MGGAAIVLGLAMWGYRVMATVGHNMTKLTSSRGFNIGTPTGAATAGMHACIIIIIQWRFYMVSPTACLTSPPPLHSPS
jgi:phosphate/sulfate permease